MKNETRPKILKISCVYGGVLSLILVGLYVFYVVAFPGTVKFMPLQVTLLLPGIVSVTVFSYMHLNYAKEKPEEFSCPTLPGIIITAVCLSNANTTLYMELSMDNGLGFVLSYSCDDTPLNEGWQTVELERFRLCCD